MFDRESHLALNPRKAGQICGVAARCQRELQTWAASYPNLYPPERFDPTLYSMCTLALAFAGPWLDTSDHRMANRLTLWTFGLDWLTDTAATNRTEAEAIIRNVENVADGAAPLPGDELTVFLAEIRDEMSSQHPLWREELQLSLEAILQEWRWRETGKLPTFDQYLGNASNTCAATVFAGHWATNGATGDIRAIHEAGAAVERVIRLANDIASYERDLKTGDLNALRLGLSSEQVMAQALTLAAAAERQIAHIPIEHGTYLQRQMEFCIGFYPTTDFWGQQR